MNENDVARNFSDWLNRICQNDDEIVVKRENQPIAVLVSTADYELFEELRRKEIQIVVERIWSKVKPKSQEEIERDVEHAVQEVRGMRRAKSDESRS